jgi:hypothetical protein
LVNENAGAIRRRFEFNLMRTKVAEYRRPQADACVTGFR